MNARDMNPADTEHRLIAILRGITPYETEAVVRVLLQAGLRAIEIPMNSPEPIQSIEIAVRTAERFADQECRIGAGTVLTTDEVKRVESVGGNLIVSPNVNSQVIAAARAAGCLSIPGVFTPTEAHLALESGADGLKFFPAALLGAAGIRAMRAILPDTTRLYAVGGIGREDFAAYCQAGVTGFGLGSSLYRPGDGPDQIRARAGEIIAAFAAARTT